MPSVITTDQGKEFKNALNKKMMEEFGIKHRLTTAYHPQANGLDEQFNQTLVNSLSKYTQEYRESWDENLQEVVYGYNTSVQASTKFTPFEAMFGRVAVLPVDINACGSYDPEVVLEQFANASEPGEGSQSEERQEMEKKIKENVLSAQTKQKNYYDKKHASGEVFNVGALVLKKDFTRRKRAGGKMDYLWTGPYKITGTLGKGLYKLKAVQGDKVKCECVK